MRRKAKGISSHQSAVGSQKSEVGSNQSATGDYNLNLPFFSRRSGISANASTFHSSILPSFLSSILPFFHHSFLPFFHSFILPFFHCRIVAPIAIGGRIVTFISSQKHSKQTPPFRHRFGFHQSSELLNLFSPSA